MYYHQDHSTLFKFIHDFYHTYEYNPTNFTCSTHLQCDCGPFSACLDWNEVCDGVVDCLDGHFDEEHCWLLEINQCNDDEYRCINGQCIPQLDMSYCVNSSKCISPNCLMDVKFDCLGMDDEDMMHVNDANLAKSFKNYFKCEILNEYIHPSLVKDERCDDIWYCSDDRDEIGCYLSVTLNCSSDDHICVSPHTNQYMCLSVTKENDGIIDCLGGIDELKCYFPYDSTVFKRFYCENNFLYLCIPGDKLCDKAENCKYGDYEQFCMKILLAQPLWG
ncbi:unnamed protein product [Rotaria sp. Silwood2]|nr:unnamed protein product [Rotaria sp. Silwood2]